MEKTFSRMDTTAIKGVAIIFMMYHHLYCSADRFSKYTVSFYPFTEEKIVAISAFLKICVGMYVFLSAYGLTVSLKKYDKNTCITAKDYKAYLPNRLIKLLWGYFFVYLLAVIATLVIKPSHILVYFPEKGLEGYGRGLLYMVIDFFGLAELFKTPTLNGTWWYMSFAIIIVLLVPLFATMCHKYGGLCTMLVVIILPRLVFLPEEFNVGNTSNMLRWMFTIVLGVLCAQKNTLYRMKSFQFFKNPVINKIFKFILATIGLILVFYLSRIYRGDVSNYSYEFRDGFVPMYYIYYCYEFILPIPGIRQILNFLGTHSMNVFLMHTFVRVYFYADWTYSFGNFLVNGVALLGVSVIASIIIELMRKYSGYNKLMKYVLSFVERKIVVNGGN